MTKLEKRRDAKGLSRQKLADMVGVTYEAILHYERGEREPKASILKKLAQALGCRMEDLI
ncbi:MAG: helix-turn-helix transcriptional regulator [Clostridia bacterium]|nr:helix-turn-helix transcriptional regulator [Clostridia bacterium]MBQ8428604.1 helix-turn-helix transcriptional regulator [Clostridia bacterium]